MFNHSTWIC